MKRIVALVSLSLTLTFNSVDAQNFALYASDKELTSGLVKDIYEDNNEMVWVSTEFGLNRFDGNRFYHYFHEENAPNSLANNFITSVFQDSSGNVYVCSYSGIQLYRPGTDDFSGISVFADSNSPTGVIRQVFERRNGELVAVGDGIFNLSLMHNEHKDELVPVLTRIPSLEKLSMVDAVIEDEDGSLWIIRRNKGVYRIVDGNVVDSYVSDELSSVYDIFESRNSEIFVVTLANGLYGLDRDRNAFVKKTYRQNPSLPTCSICQYSSREILIATDGQGLKIYNLDKDEYRDYLPDIGSLNLRQLKSHTAYKDKEGNIWIGIYQKGVALIPHIISDFGYLGKNSWQNDIIGEKAVTALCRDRNGVMWVGTDNDGLYGIVEEDGNYVQKCHFPPTASNRMPYSILSLLEDSDGKLWFGSFRDGLGYVDKRSGYATYLDISSKDREISSHISALAEDSQKRIWIGTRTSGLLMYDMKSKRITDFSAINHDIPYSITSLRYSPDGRLFIGSQDGAHSMDLNDSYTLKRIFSYVMVNSINVFEDESVAFSCADGLRLMDKYGQISHYDTSDGLPASNIYGAMKDSDGMIWLSGNRGMSRLKPGYQALVNYSPEDGIQGNEFSPNTFWEDDNGVMWFGGNNGISYFNPLNVRIMARQWHPRISAIYINGTPVTTDRYSGKYRVISEPVYAAEQIELSHKNTSFTLLFATEENFVPSRLRYFFKVDNDDWTPIPDSGDRLSFSSMPTGTHHLRVRIMDNQLASDEISVKIVIHPSLWASPLAFVVYALLLVALFILIIHSIKKYYLTNRQRKELEQQVDMARQKLDFFANISHDLKNPLTLIVSPLKRLMSSDKDVEHQRYYKTMVRNSERILQLINQILDVKKSEEGTIQLTLGKVEMVKYLQDCISSLRPLFTGKHITASFEHEGIESLTTHIDPLQFDRVLMNVFTNAAKFSPDNGEIVVRLETLQKSKEDWLRISVIDAGIGIPEESLSMIFTPFYQTERSMNVYHGGAGLGLHLSKSIVELHNGIIYAENNVNAAGCRIIVELPINDLGFIAGPEPDVIVPFGQTFVPDAENADTESANKGPRTKYRIMVVDNDPEIRDYLSFELGAEYHVIQCGDGVDALELMHKRLPDLIIADQNMPQMGGIELCEKIKKNINLNQIPVIIIAAKSNDEDRIQGLRSGADDYIAKPFNMDILKTRIYNLIQMRNTLRNNFSGQQIQSDKLSRIEVQTPNDKLMARIMKALDENMGNTELTIEMLAMEIGISRVHLHRKLKELTNQTTSDFIRNTRLSAAARILSEGKQSISEIASLVGFDNQANFSTAFKKLYGMSPREYMNAGNHSE